MKVTSFKKENNKLYPEAYWLRHTPASFSGGGFRVDKSAWEYGVHFRKATPEEIKEATKSKCPQIEINGYKGEFFEDYVKFGCAEIHKNVFMNLKALNSDLENGDGIIGMKSNRRIESITIGKGTFSKDQIKLITDYYLNKE